MAINYLIQRGTTWHARIDIPADIRPAFGNRRVLSKSLRTGDKLLARELAAQQVGLWKQEFHKARDAKLAMHDVWREDLSTQVQNLNERIEPRLLKSVKLKSSLSKLSDDEALKLFETTLLKMQGIHTTLSAYASSIGYPSFDEEWAIIHQTRDVVEQNTLVFELFTQLTTYAKKDQYQLNKAELEEAQSIAANPTLYKPKSPISSASIKAFEQHITTQMGNAHSIKQVMSKIKAFSKWLSIEGVLLSFDSVADYLDALSNKQQTRSSHLSALRKYHRWACRYDKPYRDQFAHLVSPFESHTHAKVGDGASESWVAFTPEEVVKLHKAAIAKGDTYLANLIVFACYTGCRIEEIGRISKATTEFEDGKPIAFRVDDSKTKAGIRTIPIHPELLPLYIQLLNDSDDGYLFKGKPTAQGLRLKQPQTRFSKLKTAQGFGKLHVFHSFRKTCATGLEHSGATEMVISSVLGHIRGSLTLDVYSAGASFEQKKEAIEKLHYNF